MNYKLLFDNFIVNFDKYKFIYSIIMLLILSVIIFFLSKIIKINRQVENFTSGEEASQSMSVIDQQQSIMESKIEKKGKDENNSSSKFFDGSKDEKEKKSNTLIDKLSSSDPADLSKGNCGCN
tara:strand:+ start:1399 stop:1767 length:369 start_codon:yes stop_codon:yes gene_type:complete